MVNNNGPLTDSDFQINITFLLKEVHQSKSVFQAPFTEDKKGKL